MEVLGFHIRIGLDGGNYKYGNSNECEQFTETDFLSGEERKLDKSDLRLTGDRTKVCCQSITKYL